MPPIVARGDIFPLNAARKPFFVKMWPEYETEFETPGVECKVEKLGHNFRLWVQMKLGVVLLVKLIT